MTEPMTGMTSAELEEIKKQLSVYDYYEEIGKRVPKCTPFNIEGVRNLCREVARLTAALEAAEHRAEAAAHDMKDIFRDTYPQKFGCICQICKGCENARLRDWCDNFDWRGPQKGASHANDDH